MQGHTVFTDNGFLKLTTDTFLFSMQRPPGPEDLGYSALLSILVSFFFPVFWIIKWHYVPQMMRSTNSFQILGRKVFFFFVWWTPACFYLWITRPLRDALLLSQLFFERCYRIQSDNTFFSGWNFSISTFAVIFDHFHLNRGVTWLPFCVYFHFIQQKVVSEVDLRWVCWITTWQRQNN